MSLPQPVPPSWKDLGKSASDLLSKDYPYNTQALEVKTKTPNGVQFRVAGSQAAGPISGELEGKYTDRAHGLTLTQAWTTGNVLRTQIELENLVAKGLKLDAITSLMPDKGTKSAALNAVYKQSGVHTRAALDVFKGPTVTADTVVGRDGFLVGAETSYNVTDGTIAKWSAALGYTDTNYAVTLHGLNKFNTFHASYYHRVSADVEAGAKAVYDTKATQGGVALEVGTKTYLDKAAFVKAKINNQGVVALGYTQALRPGVKAAFGLALDTTKLSGAVDGTPSHKVGFQFTFDS
ncbi:eukaryotic porin/Tom40 [Schizophyllum amplum]|uniref:Eukaryotic porin/Tom40 n=1 Tax=Schizophyllum amplum TaxID=97359 RepID=A0A550BW26_9AGAR|nr:eukaryotic porin/Tom40 [Auriculariopsis ampla]